MANALSVSAGVNAGFRLLRPAWRAAPAGLAIAAAGAFASEVMTTHGAAWWMLGVMVSAATGVVGAGAVYRLALAAQGIEPPGGGLGPGGVQWRGLEWRLVQATLLYYLVLGAAAAVAAGVLAAAAYGLLGAASLHSARALGEAAGRRLGVAAGLALALVFFGVLLCWLSLRLVLLRAIAAAEAKLSLNRALAATRGQVWTILGTLVVLALPTVGIGFVAGFLRGVLSLAGPGAPAILVYELVIAVGSAFYQIPASLGFAAYAYERLVSDRPSVVRVFD